MSNEIQKPRFDNIPDDYEQRIFDNYQIASGMEDPLRQLPPKTPAEDWLKVEAGGDHGLLQLLEKKEAIENARVEGTTPIRTASGDIVHPVYNERTGEIGPPTRREINYDIYLHLKNLRGNREEP